MNTDRYDDRDLVCTNLIESYDRIMGFVNKHLPDPFYLEGDMRVSLREIIFREVASNILIHREYASGGISRMIIEYGKVTTENPNRPQGAGILDLKTASPYPKNPVIGLFFQHIQRAEALGSGMHNLMRYGHRYGNDTPQLIEGDIFRMIIPVPEYDVGSNTPQDTIVDMLHEQQVSPYSQHLAVGWRFHEFAERPVGGIMLIRNGERIIISQSGEVIRQGGDDR